MVSEHEVRANHEHSALLGPKGRSVIVRIPKGAPMSEATLTSSGTEPADTAAAPRP